MTRLYTERLDAETGTIGGLYRARDEIDLNPPYQRDSDIWDQPRRRLLIDSILNGFDIPKLYFRSFVPREVVHGHAYRYAVIDGKQRLEAIWAFLDNQLSLGQESQVPGLERFSALELEEMTFDSLMSAEPGLGQKFLDFRLDVVTIETPDIEVIEDMFLRLNEATPLNAAEKRNAFGGPLPPSTRTFIAGSYFRAKLPFPNRRFRYQEIVTKFLYFEHRRGAADTKKAYLDRFARDAKDTIAQIDFQALETRVGVVLRTMESVFEEKDPLLTAVGMSSVYYLVFRRAIQDGAEGGISRKFFEDFEADREMNRALALSDEASADYDLIEFSRLAQSPNDGVALRFRRDVLLRRLGYLPQEDSQPPPRP